MKKFTYFILCFFFTFSLQAQEFCDRFNENDFANLCIQQFGPGTTGPMSSAIDIFDVGTGTAGTDGIMDVQLTLEAVICPKSACANSTMVGSMEACIGSADVPGTNVDYATDFNATVPGGQNTCVDAGGYICITIDFLNGFNSTAMGFDFGQGGNNGTSEGYEGSFGYVTAATDANGVALALPAITLGDFCNYTAADYAAGTQVSTFLGVTGPGTYQTDALNAISNICGVTTGQGGEDTGNGTGPSHNLSAATANPNLGLAPTDIITQVKHIQFYSATSGVDCDNNGLNAVNGHPGGLWSNMDFCYKVACNYTFEIIDPVPDCGLFDIALSNIAFLGAGTGTFDVLMGIDGAAPTIIATAANGATFTDAAISGLTTDGMTTYTFIIQESGNTDCQSFPITITAPKDSTPDCDLGGAFPANPGN